MGNSVKRVLFVNSEIMPFLPETPVSRIGRYLPQGIQERKKEIRAFMPRYGCINERKNQLHEVIRLSGMNIIIGDVDSPLVIKVASISSARIQVYFVDNDDFFKRKQLAFDADGKFFEDWQGGYGFTTVDMVLRRQDDGSWKIYDLLMGQGDKAYYSQIAGNEVPTLMANMYDSFQNLAN